MLLIALLLLVTPFAPGEIAFRIADPDLIPEGIAYDASTKTFFVGSTFQRKIVAVDAAGRVRDFTTEGQNGLFGVLGLRVDPSRRVLWAISSNAGGTMPARGLDKSCLGCSTVTSYSIESGALLEKYVLGNKPAVYFLNDLAIAPNGDVYLTDTMSGDVYRITREKKALEQFVSLGANTFPNGIDISTDGRTLFAATALGLRTVRIADRHVADVKGMPGERPPLIDGLYFVDNSLIAVQPFEPARVIVRYRLSNAHTIVTAEVIAAEHPQHKQPTTGVVVGNEFYYIANSQLQFFRAMYKDGAYDRSALTDVVVLKTPIR